MAMPNCLVCLVVLFLVSGSVVVADTELGNPPGNKDAVWDLIECARYVLGNPPGPSLDCCDLPSGLDLRAKQKKVQQKFCQCIENLAGLVSTVTGSNFDVFPEKCGLHVDIPIFGDMDWLNKTALSLSLQLTNY
ncbi:non-specific lipid-transfer protein A-like [Malania oleifera]|uniref:non-specific lipid-transfer protein A-like n=1 Tax=Malania oleifera TaxID=397392 RepID=UPI0025AE6095|nr:non-specific lipid-transfer protein A-like [Malania oleifera]